ncbi:MAG: class I SAM-dependent methyltransferase [Candidatus Heimdallarchaeota archaeon]|nr:class I SAM-dependent methyltransferase [Candidatus Heimdallarchaeota archaeon]
MDFKGKHVLEIGCGDGRMSFQVAQHTESLIGIDPDHEEIKLAQENMENLNVVSATFHVGSLEEMNFDDNEFDIVLFSLSLCCIRNTENALKDKRELLHDVWRILNPGGILINQMYSMRFHLTNPEALIMYILTGDDIHLTTYVGAERSDAALTYATMIEKKFKFVAEEIYPVDWYLNGRLGAINQYVGLDEYEKLDEETKRKIDEIIEGCLTVDGEYLEKGYDSLTIVEKING